jgi:hypothetical protein
LGSSFVTAIGGGGGRGSGGVIVIAGSQPPDFVVLFETAENFLVYRPLSLSVVICQKTEEQNREKDV